MLGVVSCDLLSPSGPLQSAETYNATLEGTIENTSSQRRTGEVVGAIGGVQLGSREVEIEPGDTSRVTFSGGFSTPALDPDTSTTYDHVVEVVNQSPVEDSGGGGGSRRRAGGGDSGGGGDTSTPSDAASTLLGVSFASVEPANDVIAPGETNSVQTTLANNGAEPVFAGITSPGAGKSLREIPAEGEQAVNLSVGTFEQTGEQSVSVALTDGNATGDELTVSFEVREESEESAESGSEDESSNESDSGTDTGSDSNTDTPRRSAGSGTSPSSGRQGPGAPLLDPGGSSSSGGSGGGLLPSGGDSSNDSSNDQSSDDDDTPSYIDPPTDDDGYDPGGSSDDSSSGGSSTSPRRSAGSPTPTPTDPLRDIGSPPRSPSSDSSSGGSSGGSSGSSAEEEEEDEPPAPDTSPISSGPLAPGSPLRALRVESMYGGARRAREYERERARRNRR